MMRGTSCECSFSATAALKDFLNDETEGEAGIQGGGLDKTGATGQHHLMGAEATDIVIGSLKEVLGVSKHLEAIR